MKQSQMKHALHRDAQKQLVPLISVASSAEVGSVGIVKLAKE